MHGALAASTRVNYAAIQQRFRAWCAEEDRAFAPFQAVDVIDWLAHEGTRVDKSLAARTLGVYRSAISTLHEESAWAHLPNPATEDPRVSRLLEGIKKSRRAVHFADEKAKPAERGLDLTPAVLGELAATAGRADAPRQAMLWAVVCLGTFGLLRVNELLGTTVHPERRLRVSQIRFCRTKACIPALFPPDGSAATPDHLELDLYATKADQLGNNPAHQIAAPLAVAAVWRWALVRRNLARTSPASATDWMFAVPGESPVTLAQVVTYLQDALEALGHGRPHITGKAFRRGGASALVVSNAPAAAAAAAGRWKGLGMPHVYASAEAKRQQQLEISRAMGR